LERLAEVILYRTLATKAPLYNISTLCNRNKKQINRFSESSKAACKVLKSRIQLASGSLATPDLSMGLVGLSYLKIQRCLQQTAAYA